jgi:hypothetical protein
MNEGRSIAVAVLVLAAWSGPGAAAETLDVSAGTMQLGGSLTFNTRTDIDTDSDDDKATMYILSVQPTFSAFVAKGLELGGGLGATAYFGDNTDYYNTQVNLFVLVRYVISTGSIVSPYVGGQLGIGFNIPDDDAGDNSYAIHAAFPAGILLALNQHVALNIGLAVEVDAWIAGDWKDLVTVSIPVGYMGVEAFF